MGALRPDPRRDAGSDGRDRGQKISFAHRRRPDRNRPLAQGPGAERTLAAGRVDDYPAAGPQHLPDQQPDLRPQGQGRRAGARASSASSPRTRSSSSTSTASISAAALMASTLRRDDSSAMARIACRSARRRSLPDWSRRRPTIRQPPTWRRLAVAPTSCSSRWSTMASSPPTPPPMSIRRGSGSSRPPRQNSVRYFTDWALPQLDTLIDETSEPLYVCTTLDPTMQCAADRAIAANAPRNAQGALVSLDRDGAVRAMVGGRNYVEFDLQPRDPGRAAARLGVQAVRLSRCAGKRDEADRHARRRAGQHRRLAARATRPAPIRAGHACAKPLPARSTRSARKIGEELGFSTIADMARRFGITALDLDLSVDGAGDERRPADRHDPRLRLGRRPRRRRHALRDSHGSSLPTAGSSTGMKVRSSASWSHPGSRPR